MLQHEGNKDITLSEPNQPQTHKYCMISLILGLQGDPTIPS